MMIRRLALGALALVTLAGCGASGLVSAGSAQAPSALGARSAAAPLGVDPVTGEPLKISPDDAQARATKKALAWQPDARLVAVAWGVAKFQTTSVCYHVFHSPKAGKLLKVESKLVSFWQKTEEITDKKFTWPAKLMGTLETYPVSAEQVLEKVREATGSKPVSLLVLTKANKLVPALWWVMAEEQKMVVDAKSGKVWLKFAFDVPVLPIF